MHRLHNNTDSVSEYWILFTNFNKQHKHNTLIVKDLLHFVIPTSDNCKGISFKARTYDRNYSERLCSTIPSNPLLR